MLGADGRRRTTLRWRRRFVAALALAALSAGAARSADRLPPDAEFLRAAPSGELFGLTMDAGMGWPPEMLRQPEFLILSTQGGLRAADGSPLALGLHVGHWELGLLVEAAARALRGSGSIPFAASLTDPCDGRTQGTPGMMDSLAWRNDAAIVLGRIIRSLPTARTGSSTSPPSPTPHASPARPSRTGTRRTARPRAWSTSCPTAPSGIPRSASSSLAGCRR